MVVTIANNTSDYKWGTNYRFRINVRDKYPERRFTTSSLYLTNKALPQQSYWAIKDLKTQEIVVDFDNSYTKISCDSVGSYFFVYTGGLEPERYYKLLIRTVLSTGEVLNIDTDNIIKITR
jgi:hypothetical protein